MNKITKTYTITATPDTLRRFERFMGFLHYNGGHSAIFGMPFDGDGHERFKCEPPPERDSTRGLISSAGPELELADDNCYKSYFIDYTRNRYFAHNKQLIRLEPNGTETVCRETTID